MDNITNTNSVVSVSGFNPGAAMRNGTNTTSLSSAADGEEYKKITTGGSDNDAGAAKSGDATSQSANAQIEAAAAAAVEESSEEAHESLDEHVEQLNMANIGLSFSVDADLDRTVISVMDRNTDDLVRQIPSDEFLAMAKNLREFTEADTASASGTTASEMKGALLDAEA